MSSEEVLVFRSRIGLSFSLCIDLKRRLTEESRLCLGLGSLELRSERVGAGGSDAGAGVVRLRCSKSSSSLSLEPSSNRDWKSVCEALDAADTIANILWFMRVAVTSSCSSSPSFNLSGMSMDTLRGTVLRFVSLRPRFSLSFEASGGAIAVGCRSKTRCAWWV